MTKGRRSYRIIKSVTSGNIKNFSIRNCAHLFRRLDWLNEAEANQLALCHMSKLLQMKGSDETRVISSAQAKQIRNEVTLKNSSFLRTNLRRCTFFNDRHLSVSYPVIYVFRFHSCVLHFECFVSNPIVNSLAAGHWRALSSTASRCRTARACLSGIVRVLLSAPVGESGSLYSVNFSFYCHYCIVCPSARWPTSPFSTVFVTSTTLYSLGAINAPCSQPPLHPATAAATTTSKMCGDNGICLPDSKFAYDHPPVMRSL